MSGPSRSASRPRIALDGGLVADVGQALGAGPQFVDRLVPAQQQHGDECDLAVVEAEFFVEHVAILRRAIRPAGGQHPHEPFGPEAIERLGDRGVVEVDDGLATRRLVTRRSEGRKREWIGLGGGQRLLGQASNHPPFGKGELQRRPPVVGVAHAVSITRNASAVRPEGSPPAAAIISPQPRILASSDDGSGSWLTWQRSALTLASRWSVVSW